MCNWFVWLSRVLFALSVGHTYNALFPSRITTTMVIWCYRNANIITVINMHALVFYIAITLAWVWERPSILTLFPMDNLVVEPSIITVKQKAHMCVCMCVFVLQHVVNISSWYICPLNQQWNRCIKLLIAEKHTYLYTYKQQSTPPIYVIYQQARHASMQCINIQYWYWWSPAWYVLTYTLVLFTDQPSTPVIHSLYAVNQRPRLIKHNRIPNKFAIDNAEKWPIK